MKKQYDVVIIGAGVVGSAIARELSRYKLSIAVLEKNLDVCNETSGRNSAVVHGGFANPIGSLKAKCCVEGNRIMDQLAEELNFPFKRCGKVLVGNTPEDMEQLERTMKQGAVNGCTGLEMIDEAKLHELVPAVVGKFAMWSKNSGIMDPFLYTVALAENAHTNSVDFFFDYTRGLLASALGKASGGAFGQGPRLLRGQRPAAPRAAGRKHPHHGGGQRVRARHGQKARHRAADPRKGVRAAGQARRSALRAQEPGFEPRQGSHGRARAVRRAAQRHFYDKIIFTTIRRT